MTGRLRLGRLSERGLADMRLPVLEALGDRRREVDELLHRAPGEWTLYGRAAEPIQFGSGMTLSIAGAPAAGGRAGGGESSARRPASTGPDGPRPSDAAGRSAVEHAESFCRLADALPELDLVAPPVAPVGVSLQNDPEVDAQPAERPTDVSRAGGGAAANGDQPASVARLRALAAGFAATGKHLLVAAADAAEVRTSARLAAAVAGGAQPLRDRPLCSVALLPGPEAVAAGQTAARAGLPVLVSIGRDASPASIAATLSIAAAVQGAVPEAPVGIACPDGSAQPLDMAALMRAATLTELLHSFGLPLLVDVATGATASGWLAAAETMSAALSARLSGADAISGAGLLAGGADPTALVLDAEICSYAAAVCAGLPVDEQTLAVEVIEKVGIAGNYLGERHTRRHMGEVWRPRVLDRTPYEQWLREGRRGAVDLAAQRARQLLADHVPAPLAPPLAAELDRILAESAGPSGPAAGAEHPPKETP